MLGAKDYDKSKGEGFAFFRWYTIRLYSHGDIVRYCPSTNSFGARLYWISGRR